MAVLVNEDTPVWAYAPSVAGGLRAYGPDAGSTGSDLIIVAADGITVGLFRNGDPQASRVPIALSDATSVKTVIVQLETDDATDGAVDVEKQSLGGVVVRLDTSGFRMDAGGQTFLFAAAESGVVKKILDDVIASS